MPRLLQITFLGALAAFVGCSHVRVVSASNARDQGEEIRTKYRYRPVWMNGYDWRKDDSNLACAASVNAGLYGSYQPDVFCNDGIPVKLSFSDGLNEGNEPNQWNAFFSFFTIGVVPMFTDAHSHYKCQVSIGERHFPSVEVCYKKDGVQTLLFPLLFLFYNGDGDTCFSCGHRFILRGSDSGRSFGETVGKTMAYGIASRLKEAEDSGWINEQSAALARSSQSLSETATMRAKVVSESLLRRGITLAGVETKAEVPFEIVRCDSERGKDFTYSFALRKRGGRVATIADLGDMRGAFRSAIRTHYASSHPDLNPHALVVDFTEYALKGGVVVGRVAVLTISPESLSYDSASRRGVIRVRIGEGQFEDARRWIRRNLVSFVNKSNADVGGKAIPKGSRFYSEGEEMRNGVLEVSFKTE